MHVKMRMGIQFSRGIPARLTNPQLQDTFQVAPDRARRRGKVVPSAGLLVQSPLLPCSAGLTTMVSKACTLLSSQFPLGVSKELLAHVANFPDPIILGSREWSFTSAL